MIRNLRKLRAKNEGEREETCKVGHKSHEVFKQTSRLFWNCMYKKKRYILALPKKKLKRWPYYCDLENQEICLYYYHYFILERFFFCLLQNYKEYLFIYLSHSYKYRDKIHSTLSITIYLSLVSGVHHPQPSYILLVMAFSNYSIDIFNGRIITREVANVEVKPKTVDGAQAWKGLTSLPLPSSDDDTSQVKIKVVGLIVIWQVHCFIDDASKHLLLEEVRNRINVVHLLCAFTPPRTSEVHGNKQDCVLLRKVMCEGETWVEKWEEHAH